VARWHVAVTPTAGQTETQTDRDRAECDAAAKESTGYSRLDELRGWFTGALYVPAVAVYAVIMAPLPVQIADMVQPKVGEAVLDTVTKPIPEIPSTANWGSYFEQCRTCMKGRGYSVR
jgi:hypothetical protein